MIAIAESPEIPQDIEAEQALLGAIFKRNDQIIEVLNIVQPDSFYKPSHQNIFREMIKLIDQRMPIDEIILGDQLKEQGLLEECGNYAYLSELIDITPFTGNAIHYAQIIQERALARKLMQLTSEISRKSRDSSADIQALLKEAENKLADISSLSVGKKYVHVGEVFKQNLLQLKERAERGEEINGLETGFKELDKITSGLQQSDLIVLAARPSMGKTALALNVAQYVAGHNKKSCLLFTLEMSKEQIGMRLLGSEAAIDTKSMKTGVLHSDDWEKIANGLEKLNTAPLYINDISGITTFELTAIARQLHKELPEGLDLVIVDYLQLMRSSAKIQNREQEISEISRNLKGLAKELKIPVIALAQLNRLAESRTNKRPLMSDLRESGSIEQDADIILFIYRDEVYNSDSDQKGIAELIIGKHRNGSIGTIQLGFIGKYAKFANLSLATESPN